MSSKIGIIANPKAARDIRRLVANATVIDNREKTSMTQRVILGLEAMGVGEIFIMPDTYKIGRKALRKIKRELNTHVEILDMQVEGSGEDSTRAAKIMRERDVTSIITIGGDGTNRVVAKGCGKTPLLPLSTGTNNVIPYMMESTRAGVVGGLLAEGVVDPAEVSTQMKRLHVFKNGERIDSALVDVTISKTLCRGAGALWDPSNISQVIVTKGKPGEIGMASIVGSYHPITIEDDAGISLMIEEGRPLKKVKASISVGLIEKVGINNPQWLDIGDKVEIHRKPCSIALDGEREIVIYDEATDLQVELQRDGPLLVNPEKALQKASEKNFFHCT